MIKTSDYLIDLGRKAAKRAAIVAQDAEAVWLEASTPGVLRAVLPPCSGHASGEQVPSQSVVHLWRHPAWREALRIPRSVVAPSQPGAALRDFGNEPLGRDTVGCG